MDWILKGINRVVWSSDGRKVRKLRAFARTEADGSLDLARVAERTKDPHLRESLLAHARDEMKHARLFRNRASEIERDGRGAGTASAVAAPERPLFVGELDDVEYVAFLHVSEGKGAGYFRTLRDSLGGDERTRKIFDHILVDELQHETYTDELLGKWQAEGKATDVKKAMRRQKLNRLWLRCLAASQTVSATLGQGMLLVLYFTVLVPFAVIARGSLRARPVSRPPEAAPTLEEALRQSA